MTIAKMSNLVHVVWLLLMSSILMQNAALPLPKPNDSPDLIEKRWEPMKKMIEYLTRYGHLRSRNSVLSHELEELKHAISSLQNFAGIPVTGEMDDETIKLMNAPRCGFPDLDETRKKRFVVDGSKWTERKLTYFYRNYTSKLQNNITRADISRALKFWSDASPLVFTETKNSISDIYILFARRAHGDSQPFDGPGGVLAHAFLPTDGNIHFDEDETWTHESSTGMNLLTVATHEFGHIIGMSHSNDPQAVMAPYYKAYTDDFALTKDDIDGIQAIYGKPPK